MEELSKLLQGDPSVDLAVDLHVCRTIGAAHIAESSVVVEGRMPALLAALMTEESEYVLAPVAS